jgi:hypothetical protein
MKKINFLKPWLYKDFPLAEKNNRSKTWNYALNILFLKQQKNDNVTDR